MSPKLVKSVLEKYQDKLKEASDEDLKHAYWMCSEAIRMLGKAVIGDSPHDSGIILSDEYEKVNRWLGFIQGVLWVHGVYSINEMREHNTTGLHRDCDGVQLT